MKSKKFPFKELICDGCGWVHFGVSLKQALEEVAKFNEYFDSLSKDQQNEMYRSRRADLLGYCLCFSCGSLFTRMRTIRETDKIPGGVTIQPILNPKKAKYDTKS
jgi:hypothetical protein